MAKNKNQPIDEQAEAREFAEDLERRVKGFNTDLIPLLGKWKVALGAQAVILPDGRIGARPSLIDDNKSHKDAGEAAPQAEGGVTPA